MLAGFGHAKVGPLDPEAIRTFLRRWTTALFLNDVLNDAARAKQQNEASLRGGSWYSHGHNLRAAFHLQSRCAARFSNFGFRCAREVLSP